MIKFQFIWEEMFLTNIYWFRGKRKDYEILVQRIFKQNAPKVEPFVKGTVEVYMLKKCPISVLWLRNQDVTILAHECFHIAQWNLNRAGVRLSDDSEEVYAYFIQYLMNKIRRETR